LQFSPKFYISLQKCPIPIFLKTVPILLILKTVQLLFNCISGPNFQKLHFSPFFAVLSKGCHTAQSSPRVTRSLARRHTWQAINSTQCQNSTESRHITQTDSVFSLLSVTDQNPQIHKTSRTFIKP